MRARMKSPNAEMNASSATTARIGVTSGMISRQ